MFEFILVGRFFVDFFWEYKILGILHVLIILLTTPLLFKNYSVGLIRVSNYDFIFLFLVLSFTYSLVSSLNVAAFLDFLKFTTYILIFYIGLNFPLVLVRSTFIGVFSFCSLFFFFAISFYGLGYLFWGNVFTFTGGYFFKTDLAIASIIFFVFIFSIFDNKFLRLATFLMAFYLVFISNSRIALPLIIVLAFYIYFARQRHMVGLNLKVFLGALLTLFVGISPFILFDFVFLGFLGFDFSDPFSSYNTQGRSIIWSALIESFDRATLVEKFFGSGFDSDVVATYDYSPLYVLQGARAHNSFLYLLLSIGLTGSLIFYYFIYRIFEGLPYLFKCVGFDYLFIPVISSSLLISFIWFSLTTEVVIRPQLMFPFFFFSGLHVQLFYLLKASR